ncbi:hypothetical protein FAO25_25350, partial [Klebsiella pneumoniae subsp. pneumoniae]
VCVVGKMRDLILQLSKSSIYSTKPCKPFTSILKRCPSLLSVDLIKSISWMANCQNVKSRV